MSQERLEEIKEIFGVHKIQTFVDRKTIPFNLDDIEWLIEQAEHTQELERKIERYREALEFYAHKESYGSKSVDFPTVWFDEGEKARQALESDNE